MVPGNLLSVLLKLLSVTIQHDPMHVHTTQYRHGTQHCDSARAGAPKRLLDDASFWLAKLSLRMYSQCLEMTKVS